MTKKRKEHGPKPTLAPGHRVIIVQNPHNPRAEYIVGTVMVYRARAGFGGCDLVDVHYKNPGDGRGFTLPFGLSSLSAATGTELVRLAEHHEHVAANLRSLARALPQSD